MATGLNEVRVSVGDKPNIQLESLPVSVDVALDELDDDQQKQLIDLLASHQAAFSIDDSDFGETDLVTHSIPTKNTRPIKQRFRRIPPNLYQEVRDHLTTLLRKDVIRESHSPWASPIVLVRKKCGGLRMCVDYRKLNAFTESDAYPLPRIEESLDALQGAKYFSTIDLASGYWQIKMSEDDRPKTAFTTPMGLYEFNRMPFGLGNAPATFQRFMERCFRDDIYESVLIYLDDIIIFSKDFSSHLDRLKKVLSRLIKHGLKAKPSKCHLLKRSINFLGHVVSEEGIRTDPEKCKQLEDWPTPTSQKDVRRFLGFAGYYRRFIKDFSKIASPLFSLTGGPKKQTVKSSFTWTKECQEAFDELRGKLMSPPILGFPDYFKPFILYTDASNKGLGAVLSQVQNGQEKVIAYGSRALRKAERNDANYSAFKLELLALQWAITEKFKDYLFGAEFTVYTDHNPLVHLDTADLRAVEQRWLARLAPFKFNIKYRSGKSNHNADALSRLPVHNPADDEDDEPQEVTIAVVEACCETFTPQKCLPDCSVEVNIIGALPMKSATEIARCQQSDPNIQPIIELLGRQSIKNLQGLSQSTKLLWKERKRLKMIDGILYRTVLDPRELTEKKQIVLPSIFWREVFEQYHDDAGHFGCDRTIELIQRHYFWVKMARNVREWCSACERCCLRKDTGVGRAPLVSITTSRPLELVVMDYLTVESSIGGFENILVIVDHFTKFSVAVPTRDQTATTTAKMFWKNFVLPYGMPERIHSDKGASFESAIMVELCNLYGMKKSRTTPYHPAGNGLCERFNRTLLNLLGTLSREQKSRWVDHIQELLFHYNNSLHSSTGFTPYYMMFGRHGRVPVPFTDVPTEPNVQQDTNSWVDQHKRHLQTVHELAANRNSKASTMQKTYFDKKSNYVSFLPGEKVLIRNRGLKGRSKLDDKWQSQPYIIKCRPNSDLPVYILEPEGGGKAKTLHRNELKICPFKDSATKLDDTESNKDLRRSKRSTRGQLPTRLQYTIDIGSF